MDLERKARGREPTRKWRPRSQRGGPTGSCSQHSPRTSPCHHLRCNLWLRCCRIKKTNQATKQHDASGQPPGIHGIPVHRARTAGAGAELGGSGEGWAPGGPQHACACAGGRRSGGRSPAPGPRRALPSLRFPKPQGERPTVGRTGVLPSPPFQPQPSEDSTRWASTQTPGWNQLNPAQLRSRGTV